MIAICYFSVHKIKAMQPSPKCPQGPMSNLPTGIKNQRPKYPHNIELQKTLRRFRAGHEVCNCGARRLPIFLIWRLKLEEKHNFRCKFFYWNNFLQRLFDRSVLLLWGMVFISIIIPIYYDTIDDLFKRCAYKNLY